MNNTKHTKGPMAVERGEDGLCTVSNNEGTPIAFWSPQVDAARIVHTWNCHDELLAALEKSNAILDDYQAVQCHRAGDFGGSIAHIEATKDHNNATIKKAKGEA